MTSPDRRSSCPICGCGQDEQFLRTGRRTLLICCRCRHLFWDEFPDERDLVSHYQVTYERIHTSSSSAESGGVPGTKEDVQRRNIPYFQRHLQELSDFLKRDPAELALMDFGCSFPYLLIEAKKSGFAELAGVASDEHARRMGKENGISMLRPEHLDTGISDCSIDIVRFSHVLEHLIDPLGTLLKTVKKLREKALVYITQPSFPVFSCKPSALALADAYPIGATFDDSPGAAVWAEHLHFFSPISLCLLVRKAGLEIRQVFTHQNAEAVARKYLEQLDVAYAATELDSVRSLGNSFFGGPANYPLYAGENSVVYATLTAKSGKQLIAGGEAG